MMGVDEMTMLNVVVVGEMMEIVGEVMAVDGIVVVVGGGGGEVVEKEGVGDDRDEMGIVAVGGEMIEIVGEVMAVDGIVVVVGEVVERGGVGGKADLTSETQRIVVEAEVLALV